MSTDPANINRRRFLQGSLAALPGAGVGLHGHLSLAAQLNQGHPLAPQQAHHPAKAEHLILFFMTGGMSHVDTFDHKPRLNRDAGKKIGSHVIKPTQYKFTPRGQSGRMVSELFTEVGSVIDEMCLIHSIYNDSAGHSAATLGMHTGSITIPMPSIGSWISHGLGTYNANLPPFVVFAAKEPYNAYQCWDSNFLPGCHTGTRVVPGPAPIPHLKSPIQSVQRRDLERMMLEDLNRVHWRRNDDAEVLRSRMTSFDTAYGLMREAPEAFDTSKESDATHELYSLKPGDQKSFAWQCLSARRLIERGVRVIELFDVGSNSNWDSHGNIEDHRKLARNIDRPIAALIQ
ncbi:MAG: DUF1501 domain-containing protein, partial [Planctomycetota bacterium]|nr:DUF1501 domain-containing protein [Planctomycetota bacterium]